MEILNTAKQAALEAAQILLDNFGKVTKSDIVEKRLNDFLTYVDEQSERKIISIIKARFPDHAILAEESGMATGNSDYKWIIDPLDGTKNYISGIPIFGISIALSYQNTMIFGLIYDPIRKEMYHAVKDKGAYLNDTPIKVSGQANLVHSLLATGFPFRYKEFLPNYMKCFEDIFRNISGMRRMGAAAIDLAYVASGIFEGFWEIALSPWDVAAGQLLIRESGGKVSDFWGNEDYIAHEYFVATNGLIHTDLLKTIQKYFTEYKAIDKQGVP
jgi:myo-inositol-1(or 4)-monophosphatase